MEQLAINVIMIIVMLIACVSAYGLISERMENGEDFDGFLCGAMCALCGAGIIPAIIMKSCLKKKLPKGKYGKYATTQLARFGKGWFCLWIVWVVITVIRVVA